METAVAFIAISTLSWLMLAGTEKPKPKDKKDDGQEYEIIIRPKKK